MLNDLKKSKVFELGFFRQIIFHKLLENILLKFINLFIELSQSTVV